MKKMPYVHIGPQFVYGTIGHLNDVQEWRCPLNKCYLCNDCDIEKQWVESCKSGKPITVQCRDDCNANKLDYCINVCKKAYVSPLWVEELS